VAVSAARALVTAQGQSAWNRLRHESGLAGTAVTVIVVAVATVMAVLLPGALMVHIGASLGGELARGGTADVLNAWNAVQAVFTLLFPLLGSFRFKPALSLTDFGRYPLSRGDLAMAELPAAVFEVFPLLGLAGIVATNAGLAARMPAMTPLIILLTILSVVWMLSLMIVLASAWRVLIQRRGIAIAAGACLLAALAVGSRNGFIVALRALMPHLASVVSRMPGSYGYQSLVALRSGQYQQSAFGISFAIAATAGMAILAAVAHHRALVAGAWAHGSVRKERPPAGNRGPAGGVAALFFRQLLGNRTVWILLIMPLMVTGAGVFVIGEIRSAVARDKVLPEIMITVANRIGGIPFLAVALFLAILMNAQIWMNQFGWDRSAIRVLLLLPIAFRDILTGKFLGLLQVTLLQWAISATGLLVIHYRPSAREVIGGLAGSGIAFVVTCGVGQFVSLLAPRAVPRGGTAMTPLYLSWIPAALLLALAGIIKGIWALGALAGYWVAPAAVCAALAGAVLVWRSALPQAERFLMANREKLLSM
jgi:hypothetical protein